MKQIGIIRKTDKLGRIVIPKEIRNFLTLISANLSKFLLPKMEFLYEKQIINFQKFNNKYLLTAYEKRVAQWQIKICCCSTLYISYDSFSIAASILRRVSSLPRMWQNSTPPPGVTCLPESAVRSGHRTNPFLSSRSAM